MHNSLVFGLDLPELLFPFKVELNFVLDWFLLIANTRKLLGANGVFEVARLLFVANVLSY